jgi:hypothetical protein
VLSGVSAGELVVVGGLERMGEGAPLAPKPRLAQNALSAPVVQAGPAKR